MIPERKAVIDAAKTISKWCDTQETCCGCPFHEWGLCIFIDSGISPDVWGKYHDVLKEGDNK